MRTTRTAEGLEIVEEAFAVTGLQQTNVPAPAPALQRTDSGGWNQDWAKPPQGVDGSLRNIAVHMGGSLQYEIKVPAHASRRVALALCEGWWKEAGKRVQILRVEGAEPQKVDTVADIGQNKAAAFWFDASDTNGDSRIEITVEAATEAADKNTILNGLWVFPGTQSRDSAALLAGKLSSSALARLGATRPGGPARNDVVLVRVKNKSAQARTLQPRLIIDTTLGFVFEPEAQRAVINGHETITTSLKMLRAAEEQNSRQAIQLEEHHAFRAGRARRFSCCTAAAAQLSLSQTQSRRLSRVVTRR